VAQPGAWLSPLVPSTAARSATGTLTLVLQHQNFLLLPTRGIRHLSHLNSNRTKFLYGKQSRQRGHDVLRSIEVSSGKALILTDDLHHPDDQRKG
jgi:hypothetical protein